MSKSDKISKLQQARSYLIDRKKSREIKVSKLRWNLQKILKKDEER